MQGMRDDLAVGQSGHRIEHVGVQLLVKKWNDCHTVIMANHGRIATGLSRMHQSLCVALVLSLHCHRVTLQCIFTICAQSSVQVLGARPLPSS